MFNHQRLHCYVMALALAKKMPSLTRGWPSGSGYLSDQLKRAVSSIILNIAEGNGRKMPKERKRFFNIASASASESAAIMDVAHALNMTGATDYQYMQDGLLQIVKMLCKLS